MRKGAPSVNPRGRPSRVDQLVTTVRDGWQNVITGIGVAGRDKRITATPHAAVVSYRDAIELWEGDDIARAAIEVPVEDATRKGFDFVATSADGAATKEGQDAVETAWRQLDALGAIADAWMQARAFGGAGILLGVLDGQQDLTKPMGKVVALEHLTVFSAEELKPYYTYSDPRKPKFGQTKIYQCTPSIARGDETGAFPTASFDIHESRIVPFYGRRTTRHRQYQTNLGWGASILVNMHDVLRDFNLTWSSVSVLMQELSVSVWKFHDLAALLAAQGTDGAEAMKTRVQAMEYVRSVLKAQVIDAQEEWTRESLSLSGVEGILHQFMGRMSSAAGGIPVSKLFGTAPSGLNSSGDSDISQWDDRVVAYQDRIVIPALRRITRVMLQGRIPDDSGDIIKAPTFESWKIEARPLRQQTDKEKAETRKLVADTDAVYIDRNVVSSDEVALSRFGGDAYSMETVVDFEDRASLEAEIAKQEEADRVAAEQARALAEQGAAPAAEDLSANPADDDEESEEDE